MSAHYDSYDYSSYWQGREYEHESEAYAIKSFLSKIKKIDKALEIGGGFGRLLPLYVFRAKRVSFTEASAKLLSQAKKTHKFKNVEFIQSTLENLPKKLKRRSFDLIVMIRVIHHLPDSDSTFNTIEKLAANNGYLILEFANKMHFKNVIVHLLKKDFAFFRNRETTDIRSSKSKKDKTIPFLNFHPSLIKSELEKHNFKIVETRSVSNIRSPFLKKYLQKEILLEIEKFLQKPLSYLYFGPSIFILARKKG